MKKEQLLKFAKRVIDDRRYKAEETCNQRLTSLRNENPRFCEHEQNYKVAQIKFAMARSEAEKDNAKIVLEKRRSEFFSLLNAYGFNERDLHPQYFCKFCNDTGYVDFHICSCLQNEINRQIAANSSVGNKDFTFANSTETEEHNSAVYNKASACVTKGQSILLTGNTGTGKTYLLNACCNQAVAEHKSTQLLTAYDLNSLFLDCHLSDLATQQAILDSIIEVDVLAIDDLGTETIYKNVSANYLFVVINERVNRNKQTFISTNLYLSELRERYDERIFSRLLNAKTTFIAKLQGKDKRLSV